MNKCIKYLFTCCMCIVAINTGRAQDCVPVPGAPPVIVGDRVLIANGVSTRAVNSKRLSSVILGQPFTGQSNNYDNVSEFGFYGQFLLPPLKPAVVATQGELFDRIQLNWTPNPLGSAAAGGFKIFRDGVFIELVDSKTSSFNDFNVIAGRPYTYGVVGVNDFGEAFLGQALGFLVPNGVVTGLIETTNGSPVPGAWVTLDPMQGFAAKFGSQDGAGSIGVITNNFLPPSDDSWTITFWVKTDSISESLQSNILYLGGTDIDIRAKHKGDIGIAFISQNEGLMTIDTLGYIFPNSTKHDWHHITLTNVENPSHLKSLYVDGVLVAQKNFWSLTTNANSLDIGSRAGNGGWDGSMDELRFYKKEIKEYEISEIMNGTAGSTTPDLTHYWKMDEELGTKSFDLIKRQILYFCGAEFDADRPSVATSGVTNEQGYYKIEGVNYGTGTTFIATPHNSHNNHVSLEFNASEFDKVLLDTIPTDSVGTIETWVRSNSIPNGQYQSILFRSDNVNIVVRNNNGVKEWGVEYFGAHWFGTLPIGYNHLAITIVNSGANQSTIKGYLNGTLQAQPVVFNFNYASQNATPWHLGAQNNVNYFNGFIDEVAFYNRILSIGEIDAHAKNTRSVNELGLIAYYPLDEFSGTTTNNIGSMSTPTAIIQGASWSEMAPTQTEIDHEFVPATRQVTLNPSNTSVDRVDFTDRSTIAVSGYVRYGETDCFQNAVEIYVNGKPHVPPIFTDDKGYFVIDFNPGTNAILTPKYEGHTFSPVSYEVSNIIRPVAGVLFKNIVRRKATGKIYGGNESCKAQITGGGQVTTKVVFRTANGCLEKEFYVTAPTGDYVFDSLPPLPSATVAVVQHSIPDIYDAFQLAGGSTIDISETDTVVNFTYHANPGIEFTNIKDFYRVFNGDTCETIVLQKGTQKTFNFKLNEVYNYGNNLVPKNCPIDSASFEIINAFADTTLELKMSQGMLNYNFKVGDPNSVPPHLKGIQVIATTLEGLKSEYFTQGVVTGTRSKDNTFTSLTPSIPTMILRDPPGDGSYAYLEKGETVCSSFSFKNFDATGGGTQIIVDAFPDWDISTFFGFTDLELEGNVGPSTTILVNKYKTSENSFDLCSTMTTKMSTSDGDLVVGSQGGDIYMGGALNIIFGYVDNVTYNDTTCMPKSTESVAVTPGNFATTFLYSEYNIKENVIPKLIDLRNLEAIGSPKYNEYQASITAWNNMITNNAKQKAKAKTIRNLSFDALTTYEQTITSDTTFSNSIGSGQTNTTEEDIAAEFYLAGAGGGFHFYITHEETKEVGTSKSGNKSVTTGFVLADDDPLDAFSVDIAIDSVYKTPVFRTKIGQSSCPWEPNTARRESVELISVDGQIRTNVPANKPAVYKFLLNNLSSTKETFTYFLSADPEGNPNGAKIFCNGAIMSQDQWYTIPYGESVPITVTLDRGPEAYEYENIDLVLYSACEEARATALGIDIDVPAFELFYSKRPISAYFIRPCSEVDITTPRQNWIIKGSDNDTMQITVSGYNTDSLFNLVRVQYRRSKGDGSWITIGDQYNPFTIGAIPPNSDTLGNIFSNFYWNTNGLQDGEYELRAFTTCLADASDKEGYSQVIKGVIDRQPPSLIGVPQPSDGVYHVGDEISFTFNQHINCNKLIPAAGLQPPRPPFNVGLFDATTGDLIDADFTCFENKIIIDPNFQNEFFENRILRAELHNIEDLTGNKMLIEEWEFYVDRNELAWLTDSILLTKYEDETKSITAKIQNRGGYPVSYTLESLPSWIHAFPITGTLTPNEIDEITFTMSDVALLGDYTDSIILHTETGLNPFFMGGDEVLNLGARVICRPPSWVISPDQFDNSQFNFSMNMIVKLNIEGTLSVDESDIVGAYIDGQLRGVANVEYKTGLGHLCFLTVYSNQVENETVDLQIWDASECELYANILETYPFNDNSIIGSLSNPDTLHTSGDILRKVYLHPGWNWMSLNLNLSDPAINPAMSSLTNPTNESTIKTQSLFSQYSESLEQWFGTLNTISPLKMYQYRGSSDDSLSVTGTQLAANTTITITAGWNWIGYLPNVKLPIGVALQSLSPANGDIIKSQLEFAVYDQTLGWVGSLEFMSSPNGYLLYSADPDTLLYPNINNFTGGGGTSFKLLQNTNEKSYTDVDLRPLDYRTVTWSVDPTKYEYNMNVIAIIAKEDVQNVLAEGDKIGVFVNGEIRGTAEAVYIPALQSYMMFITAYANKDGELMTFRFHDASDDGVYEIIEQTEFKINKVWGLIDNPEVLNIGKIVSTDNIFDKESGIAASPNPFANMTNISFISDKYEEVQLTIRDALGKIIETKMITIQPGKNVMEWRPQGNVMPGTFMISIEMADQILTKKLIYIN